jgi:hypothetical protein
MTSKTPDQKPPLHPANHWGPFANDPWSPDFDPVVGEAWERAARAGRVGVDPTISPIRPAIPADQPKRDPDTA